MASQVLNSVPVHRGVNGSNARTVSVTLTSALSSGQTLDIQLDAAEGLDLVPIAFRAYSNATPAVELSGPAEANLRITNHNRTTGLTRLTAAGAGIADAAIVIVEYRALT